jgi:hypothetical protein
MIIEVRLLNDDGTVLTTARVNARANYVQHFSMPIIGNDIVVYGLEARCDWAAPDLIRADRMDLLSPQQRARVEAMKANIVRRYADPRTGQLVVEEVLRKRGAVEDLPEPVYASVEQVER